MNIFDIEQLNCSYDAKNVVLHVEQLKIKQGKVIFFVGPSGIGKSTILETLGLMNNTILKAERFDYHNAVDQVQDLRSLWKQTDKELSAFRRAEYSFIFQQNNLMHNFSALENVLTTALLQGEEWSKAEADTKQLFTQLNLPVSDAEINRPVSEFSGGQRQRIAFARAIIPQFSVLFCDEPTGNLDANNARQLMKVLCEKIKERNATAIIVSHDLDLAVQFADQIITIERQNGHGYIGENSIYSNDNKHWSTPVRQYSVDELINTLKEVIYEKKQ